MSIFYLVIFLIFSLLFSLYDKEEGLQMIYFTYSTAAFE